MYDYLFMVPVLNEAAILEQSVKLLCSSLERFLPPSVQWGVIIIDNGSDDVTNHIAQELASCDDHVMPFSCMRRGRGYALRETLRAFPASRAYCYLDGDIPIDPLDIIRLLAPLNSKSADIVILRRQGVRPLARRILSWGYRIFLRTFFRLSFSDVQAGVKVFNGRAAHCILAQCRENGYFLDTEFIILAARAGYRIAEVSVPWIEQRFPNRKSKIRLMRDSIAAMRALMRIRRRLSP